VVVVHTYSVVVVVPLYEVVTPMVVSVVDVLTVVLLTSTSDKFRIVSSKSRDEKFTYQLLL